MSNILDILCQHFLFKIFDTVVFVLYNKLNSKKGDDIMTLGDIIKDYRKTKKIVILKPENLLLHLYNVLNKRLKV